MTLCQLPPSKCLMFQYLDVVKFHATSALQSKYNMILSKLPHLSAQDSSQESLLAQTEWLAKFWFMQQSGGFDKLAAGVASVVPLTYPWQWLINVKGKEESNEPSCTVKEIAGALSESFSSEQEQIVEQVKLTDQNKMVFLRYVFLIANLLYMIYCTCRYQILRIYWEQLNLKNMPTFETSFILLNVLKSLHTSNMYVYHTLHATLFIVICFASKSELCKDQLQKLAQLKSNKQNLTATDVTTATSNVSSLIVYVEKSVRAAKKTGMSTNDFATFGDFFLHTPEAIVNEIVKKHTFEEEVFLLLCGTICETQTIKVAIVTSIQAGAEVIGS